MKRTLIAPLLLSLAVTSCHKSPVRPREVHEIWIQVPSGTWTDPYVYFCYEGDSMNTDGIYRIPVAGQGLPELVVPGAYSSAVSPCSNRLLFNINDNTWIMDLDSAHLTDSAAIPLAGDPNNWITSFAWLGCDTVIYTNQIDNIWMSDLTTGENKELYSGLGHAQTPTGSRNGTISFLSYHSLGLKLQTSLLTTHDGKLDTIIVLDSLSYIINPCISPAGGNILFLLVQQYARNGDTSFLTMSVNTVDVGTHAITRLVDSDLDAPGGATWVDSPTWTTDGQVIYIGYDHYDSQLWIHDLSGNNRVLLTREQLIAGLKNRKDHRP